jgi:hypothetical protein
VREGGEASVGIDPAFQQTAHGFGKSQCVFVCFVSDSCALGVADPVIHSRVIYLDRIKITRSDIAQHQAQFQFFVQIFQPLGGFNIINLLDKVRNVRCHAKSPLLLLAVGYSEYNKLAL